MMSSNLGQIGPQSTELSAPKRLKIHRHNGEYGISFFSRLFF